MNFYNICYKSSRFTFEDTQSSLLVPDSLISSCLHYFDKLVFHPDQYTLLHKAFWEAQCPSNDPQVFAWIHQVLPEIVQYC